MKKTLLVLLSLIMVSCTAACSDTSDTADKDESKTEIVTYALGETVSTELMEFTLTKQRQQSHLTT